MNPWEIFLNILGWAAVVVLIALLVAFVVAAVAAMTKSTRSRRVLKARRSQIIFQSSKDDGSLNE